MTPAISYAVHSYVDEWFETDRGARQALGEVSACGYTKDVALRHLGNFMRAYGIARNFPAAQGGSGEALLALLEQTQFTGNVNDTYVAFFRTLEAKYQRKLYSAASKLLWLRFGSPFKLYDRYADRWLRRTGKITTVDATWYGEYCSLWEGQFSQYREEIRLECAELYKVKKFFVPPATDAAALETVLRKEWFYERVFDHYISWPEDQVLGEPSIE